MKQKLIDYVEKLLKEYHRCVKIDEEHTRERSDNYYYLTRAELLEEIINDIINL